MAKRDYYEILSIEKTASDEEIKKSYRRLAIQYHPDRNPGDHKAEESFKEVNEAYQILSDARKRATYDRFGHAGLGGMGQESGFAGSFSDIFDNIFGDFFGQNGQPGGGGVDLRYNLEITFEEAVFGCEKTLSFEKEFACETCSGSGAKKGTKPKTCKTCRGTGQVRFNQGFFTLTRTCGECFGRGAVVEEECEDCDGKGRMRKSHQVVIKIPAGIDSEQRLRIRREGEVGAPGAEPGDLYVSIGVKEHSVFRREEEHILLDVPITFAQAALGAELNIPTLNGAYRFKVPAGTQHGETFHLRGKGIKRLNGSGHGDQVIRTFIEIPTRLSSKQKELLESFEQESNAETHPGVSRFFEKLKEIFRT